MRLKRAGVVNDADPAPSQRRQLPMDDHAQPSASEENVELARHGRLDPLDAPAFVNASFIYASVRNFRDRNLKAGRNRRSPTIVSSRPTHEVAKRAVGQLRRPGRIYDEPEPFDGDRRAGAQELGRELLRPHRPEHLRRSPHETSVSRAVLTRPPSAAAVRLVGAD
jgi:hypothetical protein